jgi:hypothetical protein
VKKKEKGPNHSGDRFGMTDFLGRPLAAASGMGSVAAQKVSHLKAAKSPLAGSSSGPTTYAGGTQGVDFL